MDGSAEDRGIEPLRLLPAVQRFAGVPSTHTGSVLRGRASDVKKIMRTRMRDGVTSDTIVEILIETVPVWES